ncbi:MAG: MFS transporter [Hyphomicrobiaceae bacterium]
MTQRILPVAALMLGSALLLFAGGLNTLVLPLRGIGEGFSALSLGLLGTSWAAGYVVGCLTMPRLVARVGHIRAFSVMASLAGIAVLASLLIVSPVAWVGLRAVSGFCFSGAAMIVEGWLAQHSNPAHRGRIFGLYTMINLFATTAGQMALSMGNPMGPELFVVAGIVYMLALIPPALSSTAQPAALVETRLDVPALYRRSPVAVVGVFMVGISNGAFGTLAAVYAAGLGLDLATVALFSSLPILAGGLAQLPIGYASDRMDRRTVLAVVAFVAMLADLVFVLARPQSAMAVLAFAGVLGAAIFSMYPVILAHANDHAPGDNHIAISGGLLAVFGVGAMVGPLLAGLVMQSVGGHGLFAMTAAAHAVLITHLLWRMTRRVAVPPEEKAVFVATPPARTMTPQTAVLLPLGDTPAGPAGEANPTTPDSG